MIPPGFIQDLLSRIDIVEVVGRHVELKKAGSTHKGLCPFHGEKSPSFCVTPSRQTYHCFGCGVHGNAIGFLMEYTGAGFVEAVEDLAQQAGMIVPEDSRTPEEREKAKEQKARQATLNDVLERAARHYKASLKKSPRAIDYLKGRGLTGEIAAQFALGYAPEGWRTLASAFPEYDDPLLVESGMVIEGDDDKRYDRFRDRIMFPIRNVQGEFIGFGGRVLDKGEPKYLNSPETPVFVKGHELYGLFEGRAGLRKRGYALVVEGYMDVVALAQHGFGNAVATLGTACTAEHVHKLFRFTESVIFSFDGDAAGRRAAARALEAALPHASDTRTIKFLFLPTEHDPDSYVRAFGAAGFERYVEQAVPLSRQLQESAAEGCDLSTPEGRAHMLSNARPLWSALPEGLLKRGLLGELAKRAQLPDSELMRIWQVPGHANTTSTDGDAAPARKEWKKDWKPGGSWRGRREAQDPTAGLARRQPLSAADHALRMLLLESAWFERLSHDDQQLLHELPGPHGELVQWLERYLVHHGPAAWPVLEAALAEDGLLETAKRFTVGALVGEELLFDDFTEALRKLLRSQLEASSKSLAAAGDAAGLRQVLARLRELDPLGRVDTAEK
ncbi:MAG: DNA primase [Paucibacter sp.]|nr:DNA primase [Roseateles sp.]